MFMVSLRRVYGLLFLLSIQCVSHCMEKEVIPEKMILCPENNKQTLWEAIIKNGVPHNDYDMHRQLALVSTAHNKIVEDTYRPKKKRIEKFLLADLLYSKDITGSRSWNKDFSRCAWVRIYDMADYYYHLPKGDDVRLEFIMVGCANNDPVKMSYAGWDKCYFPIFEDNVRPFFDKEGQACFYGYGQTVVGEREVLHEPHWTDDSFCDPRLQTIQETRKGIIEYCIDRDGKRNSFYCFCNGPFIANFLQMLHYPLLLKALLQSKNVDIMPAVQNQYSSYSSQKRCKIEGATLPENYKTYKQHVAFGKLPSKTTQYMSYEDLPGLLRNAFDEKYAEQQEEKVVEMEII